MIVSPHDDPFLTSSAALALPSLRPRRAFSGLAGGRYGGRGGERGAFGRPPRHRPEEEEEEGERERERKRGRQRERERERERERGGGERGSRVRAGAPVASMGPPLCP